MNVIARTYLVVYNSLSCIGWAYIFAQLALHFVDTDDVSFAPTKLWANIVLPLKIVQTTAILEVVHAIVGIVKSPVGSTLMQVSSRLFILWVITVLCPDARYHWGFIATILSWSLVEVPRYAFYALNILNAVPDWLFFLRYHLYMVLYVTGLFGEVSCMIKSLPFLSTGAYSIQMPNTFNISISLYVVVLAMIVIYALCCPIMYTHMNVQRRRAYAKKADLKNA